MALLCAGISFDLVHIYQRTRLVYFSILRVKFYLETWSWGLRDQVRSPWQPYICQSKYARFCSSPKVTYLLVKALRCAGHDVILATDVNQEASLAQLGNRGYHHGLESFINHAKTSNVFGRRRKLGALVTAYCKFVLQWSAIHRKIKKKFKTNR